ncbi:MAG TPA: hypothetical protein VJM12_20040 [Pyrinomonadaceae bacterium]|nr:hypothetical protein [Pyrinomonadaceae bacterium]
MNSHKKVLKAFLFWLVAVAVGTITYILYLGLPGPQFIQIILLSSLLALTVIYFLLRATKLGKNWANLLGAGWFIGSSALFTAVPTVDARVLLVLLLAIGLSLNLGLSLVLKRRVIRKEN